MSFSAGFVTNANVSATAAIALSKLQASTTSIKNPANQTTASLSNVMLGFGATATYNPTNVGKIKIFVFLGVSNNTGGDGAQINSLRYGTGAAPANGDAQTGTSVGLAAGNIVDYQSMAASDRHPTFFMGPLTGLTTGTTYWFDLSAAAVTGGTVTFANVIFVFVEDTN